MKNIVGNLKSINAKIMNIDVLMDNVFHSHSFQMTPLMSTVLMALTELNVSIIFMLAGFIDDFLCIITFKNKIIREVGCGF
jgi:hypothetical protein